MNLPTKLTILRIILIPVFIVLFFVQFPFNQLVAMIVFVVASFTDFLDGYIARKYNMVTDLGKFLDPIADKMLVSCALLGIIWLVRDAAVVEVLPVPLQIITVVCAMLIICRELMISGFRIVASSKNVVLAADKLGKIKTVLQMVALILLLPASNILAHHVLTGQIFLYSGLILLGLATIMTVVSAVNYLVKNKNVLK